MEKLDTLIISGNDFIEQAGAQCRSHQRLHIDGVEASTDFLMAWYASGQNTQRAFEYLSSRPLSPYVSLNGIYLYQLLSRAGFFAELVMTFDSEKALLERVLIEQSPSTVVLSTTFLPDVAEIESIASFVKAHCPSAIVIAGGMKIWKSYQVRRLLENSTLSESIASDIKRDHYFCGSSTETAVDFFVLSDRGEQTLLKLLSALRGGEDPRELDNVAYVSRAGLKMNPIEPEPYTDFCIDWSSIPERYINAEVPIVSSTGCRYRCTFCDFFCLQPVWQRTTDAIVEEIKTIPLSGGRRRVFFCDDNLFFSKQRTIELCKAFIAEGLQLEWRSFARVAMIDREVAALFAESGCKEVLLGIESGDPLILKNMNKSLSPEKILRGVNELNRCGIDTQSTIIIGFPGETGETIKNTVDMLNSFDTENDAVHRYYTFVFNLLPLSPSFKSDKLKDYHLEGYMDKWSHRTMDSDEASDWVRKIGDMIKPDLVPIYMETGLLPGLSPKERKQTLITRNHILRAQKGLDPSSRLDALWKQLEANILKTIRTARS